MAQRKSQGIAVLMGNLNSRNGKEKNGEIVCKFENNTLNEPGENQIQIYTANDQGVANIQFQENPKPIWTCEKLGGATDNRMDYITINNRFRCAVLQQKTPYSQRKLKRPKLAPKLQYHRVLNDPNMKVNIWIV